MRTVHALHWNGSTVVCGQGGCCRSFTNFNSLWKHIYYQHRDLLYCGDDTSCLGSDTENDGRSAIVDIDEHSDQCNTVSNVHCVIDAEDYVDIPSHFNEVMSDFVWQMQAKSSANIKLLDEVIVMVRTLVMA
jgi:hypothetical protein